MHVCLFCLFIVLQTFYSNNQSFRVANAYELFKWSSNLRISKLAGLSRYTSYHLLSYSYVPSCFYFCKYRRSFLRWFKKRDWYIKRCCDCSLSYCNPFSARSRRWFRYMYIVPVVCVTISPCGYWSSTKAFCIHVYRCF